jgi:UDP-N-acetylmuramate--alanine ligase
MSFADRRLHLVGAGGAGVSALAVVAYAWGAEVSGCDHAESPYLRRLDRLGIPVTVGHDPAHLFPGMEVVASGALPAEHAELEAARALGLPLLHRAELLAEVVAARRRSVCVAGAHGKTTTAAMIAYAAARLELDPTFLVGGEVPQLGGNAGPGASELLVAEADESDGSLTLLRPRVAVVTNVELDHHAHFGSEEELRALFATWTASVPADGAVLLGDGVDLPARARVERFGVAHEADWQVTGLELAPGRSAFWLQTPEGTPTQVSLAVPGAHNAVNAAGAIAALAAGADADPADAAEALADFRGAARRFEFRGTVRGARIFDEYSHHPTEVEAAIRTARGERPRRLVVCFQPHLYTRTQALAGRFGQALAAADEVVVTDIYAAREAPIDGVSADLVVRAAAAAGPGVPVTHQRTLDDAAAFLRHRLQAGDLVLTVGAGDVRRVGDLLLA